MKTITTLLTLLFFVFNSKAQDPNIQWQKTIGGSSNELFSSLIKTTDGGFFIGGSSESDISGEKTENSRGSYDYWVLKLEENGTTTWQKTYGGSDEDFLSFVEQTADGGYILGGTSKSDISGDKNEDSQGDEDYWVLKIDSSGNILWQNTIGGSGTDDLGSMVETDDGGYLLVGNSTSGISGDRTIPRDIFSDVWVVKLNSSGAIMWQNVYVSYGNAHEVSGLVKTNDGGYVITSSVILTLGFNDPFWVLKIDASGNQVWDRVIEGNFEDTNPKISTTNDGGYIVAATSNSDAFVDKTENSINGSYDFWILKLDENGTITWQNTIGGNSYDSVGSIFEYNDGGYLVSGSSNSNISGDKTENSLGSSDYWVIKLNTVGIIEWQNTIGGAAGDPGKGSIQMNDGNFIIGGHSNSNISGDKTENSRGDADFWIIKHGETLGLEESSFNNAITLYPNPVQNTLQINTQNKIIDKINIYSILGSRVRQLKAETVSPSVDVSNLASGVYYVQLYSGKNVALKKFVKE